MFPAGFLKVKMKTLSLFTHPCVVPNLYDSPGTQNEKFQRIYWSVHLQ